MSTNENESLDIRLSSHRLSSLDFEELNRMERPSRIFSSRHHLSIPPVLTDTNNMELEQHRRTREYSRLLGSPISLTPFERNTSISNGDNIRNRSPLVRFTITNPETQQVGTVSQTSVNSSPPDTQTNSPTNDDVPRAIPLVVSEDSGGDEGVFSNLFRRRVLELLNFPEHTASPSQTLNQFRNSLSGRRLRRFAEYPYRNNLVNNPSNGRTNNRHVSFSLTNRGYNDHPSDRSQTPEQELPEVLEQEIEPEIAYEEYPGQESMSSVSSHNDVDSGDDQRSVDISSSVNNESNEEEEENRDTLETANETPRTRAVPFIASPIHFSPITESQPEGPETPAASINNNVSRTLSLLDNDDDEDHNTVPMDFDVTLLPSPNVHVIPAPPQFTYVIRSDITNQSSNALESDTVNANNRTVDLVTDDSNATNSRLAPPHTQPANAEPRNVEPRIIIEDVPLNEDHPETYEDLNNQLVRLFECPVCFEHIAPPVFQCCVGHLICHKCVIMCDTCPTCRNPFNPKRNLYMEKVGYLLKFPCKNALTGCKEQLFISQKEIHEQDCGYRHFQCFITSCSWKGYYPELGVHMVQNHSSYILSGSIQFLDIMIPNNNHTQKWFLKACGECFAVIAHSIRSPRRAKIQVHYVGQAASAKKFTFTITLTQNSDCHNSSQKLMYSRTTLPYSEIYEMCNSNNLNKNIFSMPGEVLEPFIRKRRCHLPIKLKIERVN